ncbi:MAG: hypothetical protein AB1806_10525 [Acidobacteriota bacterium]
MRHPTRRFGVLLFAAVALACGGDREAADRPAQPPDEVLATHLAGLHASDLTTAARERGLVCQPPARERDQTHWICEARTPLTSYLFEFYGKVPGRLEYIRLVISQSGPPKLEHTGPWLGYLASLRYEGADAEAARTWIEAHLDGGGQTTIGTAKLKLSGDMSRLVTEIKAPGSEW